MGSRGLKQWVVTSISHMGQMRDSDWSRPNLLRSDWLLPSVAPITTVPVFKSGDESKPGNYRPISLLSIFNRIFESWFIKDLLSLLINIIYYIHHNMDSAVGIVHSTQL